MAKFKFLKVGLLCAVASVALSACGQQVQPGNEGILIKNLGSGAGVQEQPLNVGWHATGVGEHILEYPTITKNYSFAAKGDGDNKDANEEIVFADSSGLPMSADIQITVAADPKKVADIYKKYRLDFSDLLYGPIRAQVRTSIAAEASQVTSTDMFSAQRATVINKALVDVQKHFEGTGVVVSDIQWLGNIRAPQQVLDAIKQRTQVEQQTQIALANQARTTAEAKSVVIKAQGEADAMKIRGDAIRSNPQVLSELYLNQWNGVLPTVMSGTGSPMTMMLNPSTSK